MKPKRILILVGGAWHDFSGFVDTITPLLTSQGYEVTASDDNSDLRRLDALGLDGVISYTSHRGAVDDTGRVGVDPTAEEAGALVRWVEEGKGFLGVHCASVSAEPSGRYSALLGGRFLSHPKPSAFAVRPVGTDHPICRGVGAFEVFDEFYINEYGDDITVLMTADLNGQTYPMVWHREQGGGRVAYLAPGHFPAIWEQPSFQRLLLNGVSWVTRGS